MSARQLRWCLLFTVSACTGLSTANTPVAIEFIAPVPTVVDTGQTVTLRVLLRDRAGEIVSAPITVMSLGPAYLRVDSIGPADSTVHWGLTGLKLDSLGRPVKVEVVATSGNLQSIPLIITVDSL